jgi:D-lactate dehydrogenase (cytochrome)
MATGLVAVADVEAAIALHSRARLGLADELIALELMGRPALTLVLAHVPGTRDPLPGGWPWYVLLEIASAREQAAVEEDLETFLGEALHSGLVKDGVLAHSRAQREEFWRLRHSIPEAQKLAGASIKHDISVPVSRVADFLREAGRRVAAMLPGVRLVTFGHLGDGNLHFNVNPPERMEAEAFLRLWQTLSAEVHAIAVDLGGSFSAEHGIGLLKVRELQRLRGGVEIELMKTLKRALDPAGIMNPGKVLGE